MHHATETKNRNACNGDLADICRTLHQGLPIDQITAALNRHGFDGSAMDGIYCGETGKVNEKVGERTWIFLSWYRFIESGRYEVVSYLS